MIDLFTDPDRFFAQRKEQASLLSPALIVTLAGITNVLSFLILTPRMMDALPEGINAFVVVGNVIGAVGGLFGVFLLWVVYAGLFHTISGYFDGEGTFRDVLFLVGWGFVPIIFAGIVGGIATYLTFNGVTFPQDPQKLQPFIQQMKSRPLFQVSSLLGIVFTLWSGFLWTFSVKHAKDIELREAAIAVAIPVCVSVAWRIYNIV